MEIGQYDSDSMLIFYIQVIEHLIMKDVKDMHK